MNDYQLHSFLSAARLGSFNRAAKEENIAVQALAVRIKGLENELGVKLFERTSKGVVLTPAGEEFTVTAKSVLSLLDSGRGRAREAEKQQDRVVRIGADWRLPPLMQSILVAFKKVYPETKIELVNSHLETLQSDLLEGKIDVAMGYSGISMREGVESRYLWSSPFVCAFRPENPLAAFEEIQPVQLRGFFLYFGFDYTKNSSLSILAGCFPGAEIGTNPVPGEAVLLGCLESDHKAALFPEESVASACPPLVYRPIAGCLPYSYTIYYRITASQATLDFVKFIIKKGRSLRKAMI